MNDRALDMTMRTVAVVLWASQRSSARLTAHWRAPAAIRIRSGTSRVGAGDPLGHGAQVVAGQGGGVEVGAQVVTGLGGPEGAVLDALLRHGERERVGAADGGGRVLAAVDRGPAEGGGDAADVLGVEHVHRAEAGADRGGQGVDVGLGAGGDDRAGVAQDDVGQERGLVASGAGT